jgi:hypothetical protein
LKLPAGEFLAILFGKMKCEGVGIMPKAFVDETKLFAVGIIQEDRNVLRSALAAAVKVAEYVSSR